MADSGHKSRTSKTMGVRFKSDSKRAVIPKNKGGEVAKIKS